MSTDSVIYLDNQATTCPDPRVIDTMVSWMIEHYANVGSITHEPGRIAKALVDDAIASIASCINAEADEIVITSGATESNNLAILGSALHPRQARRRIVTVATEHRAVLDPVARLEKLGFEVVRLPVIENGSELSGMVDMDLAAHVLNDKTALLSVMFGNNEIGTLQDLEPLIHLCRKYGIVMHVDAAQSVGKVPLDLGELDIDLMSFSAHKIYGPKGVGGLFVRQATRTVRLQPQIFGGGQQHNFRSGTLNSGGIIGMAKALDLACEQIEIEQNRIAELRDLLWVLLIEQVPGLQLNGPHFNSSPRNVRRLAGNLNVCFPRVEGQSLMLALPQLAVSSGSACTSAEPHPSHVLRAIGLSEDEARCSLRFGIGRFNTEVEIRMVANWIGNVHRKLSVLIA